MEVFNLENLVEQARQAALASNEKRVREISEKAKEYTNTFLKSGEGVSSEKVKQVLDRIEQGVQEIQAHSIKS